VVGDGCVAEPELVGVFPPLSFRLIAVRHGVLDRKVVGGRRVNERRRLVVISWLLGKRRLRGRGKVGGGRSLRERYLNE